MQSLNNVKITFLPKLMFGLIMNKMLLEDTQSLSIFYFLYHFDSTYDSTVK